MTCLPDCAKNHTHKGFSCDVCNPSPEVKDFGLKEEFIHKFTVWNDKYKYATLYGKEEYPTPEMLADWWIEKTNSLLTFNTKKTRDEISQKIGGLRQWLNEKSADRLVTNEDIKLWLGLSDN